MESQEVCGELRQSAMNRDIVREVKQAFELFDMNSDGKLSFSEAKKLLQMLNQNPTDQQVEQIFKEADKDGNQALDKDEYEELLYSHIKSRDEIESELRKAFRLFDSDGNGTLEYRELKTALRKLGEPMTEDEIRELFDQMKKGNGGNQVDVDAFVKTMCTSVYEL